MNKPSLRLLLVAALTACVMMSAAAVVRSAPLETYEINAIIPLTGGGAFLGKSYVETFRAVEKLVNSTGGIQGHPVKFVTADTQTNGQVDVELVNSLIAKRVPVFIDGAPSTVCLPSIPLVVNTGSARRELRLLDERIDLRLVVGGRPISAGARMEAHRPDHIDGFNGSGIRPADRHGAGPTRESRYTARDARALQSDRYQRERAARSDQER
jgi:hypothetical protein